MSKVRISNRIATKSRWPATPTEADMLRHKVWLSKHGKLWFAVNLGGTPRLALLSKSGTIACRGGIIPTGKYTPVDIEIKILGEAHK